MPLHLKRSLPHLTGRRSWSSRIESLFMEWWWVALCLIVLALVHGHSAEAHEQELAALQLQLRQLQADMTSLRVVNESLTLQINSQSDPEYVELVLRKGLGLVPEGQTKVYFAPQEQGI